MAEVAVQVSKGITKSTCEDPYRIEVDIVHGGMSQRIFGVSSKIILYDSLRNLLPEVRYKCPISLLLQVLLELNCSLKQFGGCLTLYTCWANF